MGNTYVEILCHLQQAAARENKDNKEVKDRADRARAAKAEREGAAATAQAYKSALGLAAKPDWGAAKSKATPTGKGSCCPGPIKKAAATIPAVQLPYQPMPRALKRQHRIMKAHLLPRVIISWSDPAAVATQAQLLP